MRTSHKLTIFEGPDGAGKTTAARAYAKANDARYIHFGPLFQVTSGLGRTYVEAMLPALLGHQHVVWDRSWLSETPYGNAFRNGQDRLGDVKRAMLERLAMRCETVVVRCDPGWETILHGYEHRGDREEMLTDSKQLYEVYQAYSKMYTALPTIDYAYNNNIAPPHTVTFDQVLEEFRTQPHALDVASAGNLNARVILVGESFAEPKNEDAWYQWPFASFSKQGCSAWLTGQLVNAGITEDKLFWINADQDLTTIIPAGHARVFALGAKADEALDKLAINHYAVKHPQHHKRFMANEPYPLITMLKEFI